MATRHSRRWFFGQALCSALRAEPNGRYYRIEQSGQTWRIVSPDGVPVVRLPRNGDTAFLVAIPLLDNETYADVFASEVQEKIWSKCESQAKQFKESPELIAYTWTGLPPWNRNWANWYRALHGDSGGKQQYIQFLKETYNYQIGDVNAVYGIDSTSFTDLGQLRWNVAALDRPKVKADDETFLGWIAQSLFGTAADAIRKADPNHVILGQSLPKAVSRAVVQAAATAADTLWLDPTDEFPGKPVIHLR